MKIKPFLLALLLPLCSCGTHQKSRLLEASDFDTTLQGKKVELITLTNGEGMTAQFTNYGARLVSLWVPDRKGEPQGVVWGYPSIGAYLDATDVYAGPVVGRYGNRIAGGRFMLDSIEYQLTVNEGENHLHGGEGFHTKVWTADRIDDRTVRMTYLSPDGEDGYPGNLTLQVTYSLTADNALRMEYSATTDQATVLNPTNHSYFNLHGTSAASIDSHELTIHASRFTPTDEGLIPTGELWDVEGTPMDFRTTTPIGLRVDRDYEPLRFGSGYDHNFVLDKAEGVFGPAAEVYEPSTGIVMEVLTDQPALQFYGGNGMDGKDTGKYGQSHDYRTGIALEAQNYPDAPNHAHFPTSVLRPGQVYKQVTEYRFSVR